MASKEQILTAVLRGNAVCFLGSGFSIGGLDSAGQPLPSTETLTNELKDLAGISKTEQASLSDIAEIFENSEDEKRKLNLYLQRRLTITKTNATHDRIGALPWRAIFTTNFDDLIERTPSSVKYVPVGPNTDLQNYISKLVPINYLHGRAADLLSSDIDPHFVISESNYLNISKNNRILYDRLLNEIFHAEAIVLIGYSIKDLEIAQNFMSVNPSVSNRTLIISSPRDGVIATNRLKKYGAVLPIGADGFLNELDEAAKETDIKGPSVMFPIKLPDQTISASSEDILSLILRGELLSAAFVGQIEQHASDDPLCVIRQSSIDKALAVDDAVPNYFIVTSDFANGKSLFLQQLSIAASLKSYSVYKIESNADEWIDDIDIVTKDTTKKLFIIDDAVRYRRIIDHISPKIQKGSILICSVRGDQDDRIFEDISNRIGKSFSIIDLNLLNNDEIMQWDKLLERWGYWEDKIKLTSEQRQLFLKSECSSENRSIILSIFRTSKVGAQIEQIVNFFLSNQERKEAFAGLLISSLCQQHVPWDRLVFWLEIDEASLKADIVASPMASFFRMSGPWNAFTSTQLADFILRSHFMEGERDLLLEIYTKIVLSTAGSANDSILGRDSYENLKELMKYRFLTRLFGENNNSVELIAAVYKRLSKAGLIRDNPQFWLQYAMSRMDVSDLVNAEIYLKTALGLAEKRGKNYSPFQILDQRARLYLTKNCIDGKQYSITEINLALRDLINLSLNDQYDIVYPFRSVPKIEAFLECHIDNLDSSTKSLLDTLLARLDNVSKKSDRLPKSLKGETNELYGSLKRALLVLKNG